MFSEEDLAVLKPGWDNWLKQNESEKERERESFYMRAQAMAYQQDRASQKQIELLKLELLGAATGVTNIWQVGLTPARGRYGRPMVVLVSAPNSQAAGVQAMKTLPRIRCWRYPKGQLLGNAKLGPITVFVIVDFESRDLARSVER